MTEGEHQWSVYLIECENGAYYCGISKQLARRWQQHVAGKAAKYTRANRPCVMKVVKAMLSHSEALQTEHRIKQLARKNKQQLWQEAVFFAAV